MASIVVYTDGQPPKNEYPTRIVSPLRSGPCCFTAMEEVGTELGEERWVYRYKRCTQCGFTVRVIERVIPDERLKADLRETLRTQFVRG